MDNRNSDVKKEHIDGGIDEVKETGKIKAPSRSGAIAIERDKIVIFCAMLALATVLFLAVLAAMAIDIPVKNQHEHTFNLSMELVDGKFNLLNNCTSCGFSEYLEKDVKGASVLVERAATCDTDGKRIYVLYRDDKESYYEEILPKTNHKINGVSVEELKNEDGYLLYDSETINMVGDADFVCGEGVIQGVFVCSECATACYVDVLSDHAPEDEWSGVEGSSPTCTMGGKEVLIPKN